MSDQPFLKQVTRYIIENYQEMSDLTVVLPNRRAGLFLKKQLAAELNRTFFPPEIVAIEDFIFRLSGYQPAEHISLLFELYSVHSEIAGKEAQPFEQFSGMASILLSDFNEIDLSLIDAEEVYNYLSEIKAIHLWNMGREPLTEFQQNYLGFYRSLHDYYQGLNTKLESKNIAYQGKAYRDAWHRIQKGEANGIPDGVLFCGFNALSLAEESVIRYLVEVDKAKILWDADEYYLRIRNHEAGRFLNDYFATWAENQKDFTCDLIAATDKNIQITGVPRSAAQAAYAGQVIRDLIGSGSSEDQTAVVLADEQLLVPVLNSIPEEVNEMNITMGYPLKFTPLARLLKDIVSIQAKYEEKEKDLVHLLRNGVKYRDE